MGITYNKEYTPKDRRIMPSGPRDRQRKLQQQKMSPAKVSMEFVEDLKAQISELQKELHEVSSRPSSGYTAEQLDNEIIKAVTAETAEIKASYEAQIKDLEIKNINLGNSLRNSEKKMEEMAEVIEKTKLVNDEESKSLAKEVQTKFEGIVAERDAKIDKMILEHETAIKLLQDKLKDRDSLIEELKKSKSGADDEQLKALLAETTKKLELLSNLPAGQLVSDPDRPQMEEVFIDPLEDDGSKMESHIDVKDMSSDEKEEVMDNVAKLKNLIGKLPVRK
jgi:uncharacterized protein YeeX (DUF496 family)